MRRIAAIVVLAAVPFCWQPLRGQAPGVGIDPGHKPKQQSNLAGDDTHSAQVGTQSSPLIVETHERAQSNKEAAETQKDKDHAALVEGWTLFFAGAAAVFTGLLVWVGWRGVNAALDTLSAMRRQADLMERQTALTQAAFDQWVEFQNWLAYAPQENVVRIEVFMVNPTDFPVHITDGRVTVLVTGGSVRSEMGEPTFLSPKQPHRFDIPARITDEERERGSVRFFVTVEFAFLHRITKEKQIRGFDGYISGRFEANGQWSSEFEPWNQLNVENKKPEGQPN